MNWNPFDRPFQDGTGRVRRRYPGEKRGYNPVLLASQLVGALIALVVPAALMAAFGNRTASRPKKPLKHA